MVSSSSENESHDDGEDDSYSMDDAEADEEKQLRQLEDFTKGGDPKLLGVDSKVSLNNHSHL